VLLRDKPLAMLKASAKATVPVLVLPDGEVIDESFDIMQWALEQRDPDHWWRQELATRMLALVEENDFTFKQNLDRYKYADRHPQHPQLHYRTEAEKFLLQLETLLSSRPHLLDEKPTFVDIAVFPFIRQFALVDKDWFDLAPYGNLQHWLQRFLDSDLFTQAMRKYPRWRESQTAVSSTVTDSLDSHIGTSST